VLVIEDELPIRRSCAPAEARLKLVEARPAGRHRQARCVPGPVLLDLGLPTWMLRDRAAPPRVSAVPILVLTRAARRDKIRVLDGGADDY